MINDARWLINDGRFVVPKKGQPFIVLLSKNRIKPTDSSRNFCIVYCEANVVNGKYEQAKETLANLKKLDSTYPQIPVLEKLLKGK
jgi:hypothetical protein